MLRRALLIVLPVIALAAATTWWYAPSRVVQRRTEELLTHLTIRPNGGVAARQAVIYALDALLSSTVTLESPDQPEANGTFSSEEIANLFSLLAEHSNGTQFTREHIHSVSIHDSRAVVDLTLHAQIRFPNKDLINDRFRAQLTWQQDGNQWLLTSATGKKIPSTP